MDKPSEQLRKKLEKIRKGGKATPVQIRDLEHEVGELEGLETILSIMMDHVDEYAQKLIDTPPEKLSPQEKLWLMAYDHADYEMDTGAACSA